LPHGREQAETLLAINAPFWCDSPFSPPAHAKPAERYACSLNKHNLAKNITIFVNTRKKTQFVAAPQHIFNRKFVLKPMFIVKICRKFLHFVMETKVLVEQVFDSAGKFISGTLNALDESLSALLNIRQMRACNTISESGS
jgi:hypothetical protein